MLILMNGDARHSDHQLVNMDTHGGKISRPSLAWGNPSVLKHGGLKKRVAWGLSKILGMETKVSQHRVIGTVKMDV
jgi:hypothetical protein